MIEAVRTFRVTPTLPGPLARLAPLAHNLRWAWDPPTQELFRWADARLWEEVGGNPVALLGRLSAARMAELEADPSFCSQIEDVHAELDRYLTGERWAQAQDPPLPRVAYFSPEFGITGAMQTYSGGLGVLAGDHLKAASDLGLDLVGVGLLYRHGYFRQHLDADGWQQEHYPDLNPYNLPLRRLEEGDEPLTVTVDLAGNEVQCQIWKAEVGRIPLLLLDTDVPGNAPEDRTVTDKLYGGDVEHRLRQEIVLGIGGMRALEVASRAGALGAGGWQADVYHSNEGHAGFLELERIRTLVGEGLTFDEAVESARSAVLFTTHTPVPAGIDVFPRDLMSRYFNDFAAQCGVDLERLLAVGQAGEDGAGPFNMAFMALRLSARANGVSLLHGRVAREMFQDLWPDLDEAEVPITSVTNGVHLPTWIGREMRSVFDRNLPPDWGHNPDAWAGVGEISDDVLWRARERARERLITSLREWVRAQAMRRGETAVSLGWVDELFDPDALTIGFARRFAEYKRGTLLLRQPERLRELLTSTERPVQLVFAGKAHPRDDVGKGIIRELVHFASSDPELRARLVFVEDYDIELAGVLYQGADVWLNNPRRPYEACGTSGQKAVLNGALHCSTLDGWWDEMFDGDNGFAIGTADEPLDTGHQDAADAQSLYDLLERTVVPMFYDRPSGGMPRRWLALVRRSLATLGPRVLATRMVREYASELYAPIAAHTSRLAESEHERARALATWRDRVRKAWPEVQIRQVDGDEGVAQLGEEREVRVVVHLGPLAHEDVCVELLHGGVLADGTLHEPTVRRLDVVDGQGPELVYAGTLRCDSSGEYGFTARVVPHHEDLLSWTDVGLVAWA